MTYIVEGGAEIDLVKVKLVTPSIEVASGTLIFIDGEPKTRDEYLLKLLSGTLSEKFKTLYSSPGKISSNDESVNMQEFGILLDSENIYDEKTSINHISYITSNADTNILGRTVNEDLRNSFYVAFENLDSKIIGKHAKDFGLELLLNNKTVHLSGGEKQRLNIASALVGEEKKLYVIDFTSESLDENFTSEFFQIVGNYITNGGIVIISCYSRRELYSQIMGIGGNKIRLKSIFSEGVVNYEEHTGFNFNDKIQECDEFQQSFNLVCNQREIIDDIVLKVDELKVLGRTVSFDLVLKSNEIKIITGKNGIGKSTVASYLSGFLKTKGLIADRSIKIEGCVEYCGHEKPTLSPQRPSSSIIGRTLKDELFDYACLDLLGLSKNELDLDPRQFSYGMRKLISISNALSLCDKVCILDEPTSGLYHEHKMIFISLLKHYSDKSIIIFTHDEDMKSTSNQMELLN